MKGENQGILNPKPMQNVKVLSGPQKAMRLAIAAAVLVIAVVIVIMIRNQYQKPIKTYYKALHQKDASGMCEAFPSWLIEAPTNPDAMSIYDMCSVVVSSVNSRYGAAYRVSVDVSTKTEVEADYLQKLEDGIRSQYQVEVDVSEGLRLKLVVMYSNGSTEYQAIEYAKIYKINGHWYLLDVPNDKE